MKALQQQQRWRVLLLFFCWLLLLGYSMWYFIVQPRHWFDSTMVQPPLLAATKNQQELSSLLQKHFPQLQANLPWLVRFKQQDCSCERFVERYHRQLSQQPLSQLQAVTLDLQDSHLSEAEKRALQDWIPATPAVALFSPQQALAYFGPYHQEGICNNENSFLEPVIAAIKTSQPVAVLNTLVYGCFCPNKRNQTSPY